MLVLLQCFTPINYCYFTATITKIDSSLQCLDSRVCGLNATIGTTV